MEELNSPQQIAPAARSRAAVSVRVNTAPVVAMDAMKEVIRQRKRLPNLPAHPTVLTESPTHMVAAVASNQGRHFVAVTAKEICAGETSLVLEQWTETPGGHTSPRAGQLGAWLMLRSARRKAEAPRRRHLVAHVSLGWLVLLAIGFANGTLRELALNQLMGEPAARIVSVLTAILLMTAAVWAMWPWLGLRRFSHAVRTGAFWLVLTAAFEAFVLNRWLRRMSWSEILASYNVAAGELWPLVLLWIAVLPAVIFARRGRAPLQH